ncbi:DegV family protein [Chloroflexota bacterium]
MSRTAVVTDSTASIPERIIKELNIHLVPYYIHRGEEVLLDLVTVQRESFFKRLTTANKLPTTANPGPGDYLKMYTKLVEEEGADGIISIHMTSKGSGAYGSATVAKSMFLENFSSVRVEVIETLNVSMCQGWMVIEAAKAALASRSLDDILQRVKSMIPITHMIQTADTLKYLYMGGRNGKAKHLLGSLLNIKPLIGMEDGIIVPLGQARSRKKACGMMAEMVEKTVGKGRKFDVAYVHAAALEEAKELKAIIEARLECVETVFAELSSALGVHAGPGTAGICFYPILGRDE